jgi:hypothetical protein
MSITSKEQIMPNWCANSLKIKAKTTRAKYAMKHHIMPELEKGQECRLFNAIIPMPQELIDTVCGSVAEADRPAHEAQMKANIEKHGYPTWYEFANSNWGTKWEAREPTHQSNEDGSVTIWFDTAWSPPIAIYEKLEEMGFEVEATYCEQGFGYAGWYADGEDNEHSISFYDGEEECIDIEKMEAFFQAEGLTHRPAHTGG